ncbi:MAG: C-terminal binding protein [Actinobacteria bacterium]|nr:C-terminal binding protein [Actinomycetota bacterium]
MVRSFASPRHTCLSRRPMPSRMQRSPPWNGSTRRSRTAIDAPREERVTVKVAILGTRYRDLSIEEEILAPLGAEIVHGDGGSPEAIIEVAHGAGVILAGSGPRFDAGTLKQLEAGAIVRYGVGTESIDAAAAAALGMWVAYVPDYGTEAVAVHALTMALAAARRLQIADGTVKGGRWGIGDVRPLHLPSAQTAGVVGLGRIGRRSAELLAGVGYEVFGHDPFAETPGIRLGSLAEALAADVVTLHAPGREDGSPLIGRDEIALMSEGSVLVNTSRGSLIDTAALVEGLEQGRPAVAALDVFETEPPDVEVFATVLDRVILTPHMAWYSEESERDLRIKAATEAARILGGEAPLNVAATPGG